MRAETRKMPRVVNLSLDNWDLMTRLGGEDWLTNQLRSAHLREQNVMRLLAEKATHRSIAKELGISTKTIQTTRAAALVKLPERGVFERVASIFQVGA